MKSWFVLAASMIVAIGLIMPALASPPMQPSPELAPEEVVRTQLKALQSNDLPSRDAGIEQVWAFAHPVNKRMTGPIERFARMIKGEMYAALLNHSSHVIEVGQSDTNTVVFNVDVVTTRGMVVRYVWVVARAFGGDLNGAWMTVSVSRPTDRGSEA